MGPGHENQPRPTPTQLEGVEGEEGATKSSQHQVKPPTHTPYPEVLTAFAMVMASIDLDK